MTVKVSVCVTTYNRAAGLDCTLASLAAQTRLPDEVVVSDDGSSDETLKVAQRWSERLPRFIYQRNAANLGMPENLNAAIGRTSGEYVANLHDADTFAPTMLARWEQALDVHPTAGFVFCGVGGWPHRTERDGGVVLHAVAPLTPGRVFYEQNLVHRFSSIVWGTVMARRTAYNLLLPFDKQFGFTSDVDMWMRMCRHFDVAYVREPMILLDHSTTPERGRGMNWGWVEMAWRMQRVNIRRFYGDDPARLALEYRRHQAAARRLLARRFVGRLRHGDWSGARRCVEMWTTWSNASNFDGAASNA